MKKVLRYFSSIVVVTVGVLIGAILAGNNVVAQKLAALTGVGTPGHLAMWVDNKGSLGNSSITEDKFGNLTIQGSIKFPDGSVQSSARLEQSANHHQELTILAQPSESVSFALP